MEQLRLFEDGTENLNLGWPDVDSLLAIRRTHSTMYGTFDVSCIHCRARGDALYKPCPLVRADVDLRD